MEKRTIIEKEALMYSIMLTVGFLIYFLTL